MVKIKTKKSQRPRLSVFRSNRYFYAQIINDKEGETLVDASEQELEINEKLSKSKQAEALGELLAQKAKKKGVLQVVFDKRPYKYHGRVKSFAEGARKGGLQF